MNKRIIKLKSNKKYILNWFIVSWISLILLILIHWLRNIESNYSILIYIANIIFASISLICINIKIHNFYKNLFKEVS